MFADAYEVVSNFLFPVITSCRLYDKRVSSGIASFIILNEEGWILTAAHILKPLFQAEKDESEIKEFEAKIKEINERVDIKENKKRSMLQKLTPNPDWIIKHSFWWGFDGIQIEKFHYSFEKDLAIGQLKPFNSKIIKAFPTIKNPITIRQGTSLCKLGFPFYEVKSSYDEATNRFVLDPSIFPVARFPIEGIFTRNIVFKSKDGNEVKFIETSSPGLKGQSGGPIFDNKGTVWAIQSCTTHYPLGFNPKIKSAGKEVEENQFLNCGWGVHPETVASFLKEHGIVFRLSDC